MKKLPLLNNCNIPTVLGEYLDDFIDLYNQYLPQDIFLSVIRDAGSSYIIVINNKAPCPNFYTDLKNNETSFKYLPSSSKIIIPRFTSVDKNVVNFSSLFYPYSDELKSQINIKTKFETSYESYDVIQTWRKFLNHTVIRAIRFNRIKMKFHNSSSSHSHWKIVDTGKFYKDEIVFRFSAFYNFLPLFRVFPKKITDKVNIIIELDAYKRIFVDNVSEMAINELLITAGTELHTHSASYNLPVIQNNLTTAFSNYGDINSDIVYSTDNMVRTSHD